MLRPAGVVNFLFFPISTRVDITVYQHGKCFIFLKLYMGNNNNNNNNLLIYIALFTCNDQERIPIHKILYKKLTISNFYK